MERASEIYKNCFKVISLTVSVHIANKVCYAGIIQGVKSKIEFDLCQYFFTINSALNLPNTKNIVVTAYEIWNKYRDYA